LIIQNGRKKIESITGPGGCSSCSGNKLPIRYAYDSEFRKIEEEYVNGTINTFELFTEHGDPQKITYALGTPEERVINYVYHPELGTKLTRSEDSVLSPGNNKVTTWDYDDPTDPADTSTANENPTRLLYRAIESGYTVDASNNIVMYEDITTFTYNSKGQVLTINGALPGDLDITTLTYDPITSDLLSLTQPLIGGSVTA